MTVAFTALLSLVSVSNLQILDAVVARIGREAVLLSELRAAVGLGIVVSAEEDMAQRSSVQQLVDRRLMLSEVARFPPPEPAPELVAAEAASMRGRAGEGLKTLMQQTGIDDERIRELARDTLRIDAYLTQRFGATLQVTDDDVRRYYEAHREEFSRAGRVVSFEDAEPAARQRASAERRRTVVVNWVIGLRSRADITITPDP